MASPANNFLSHQEKLVKHSIFSQKNMGRHTVHPQPTVNFSNIWLPKSGKANPRRERKVDAAATALAANVNASTR